MTIPGVVGRGTLRIGRWSIWNNEVLNERFAQAVDVGRRGGSYAVQGIAEAMPECGRLEVARFWISEVWEYVRENHITWEIHSREWIEQQRHEAFISGTRAGGGNDDPSPGRRLRPV